MFGTRLQVSLHQFICFSKMQVVVAGNFKTLECPCKFLEPTGNTVFVVALSQGCLQSGLGSVIQNRIKNGKQEHTEDNKNWIIKRKQDQSEENLNDGKRNVDQQF